MVPFGQPTCHRMRSPAFLMRTQCTTGPRSARQCSRTNGKLRRQVVATPFLRHAAQLQRSAADSHPSLEDSASSRPIDLSLGPKSGWGLGAWIALADIPAQLVDVGFPFIAVPSMGRELELEDLGNLRFPHDYEIRSGVSPRRFDDNMTTILSKPFEQQRLEISLRPAASGTVLPRDMTPNPLIELIKPVFCHCLILPCLCSPVTPSLPEQTPPFAVCSAWLRTLTTAFSPRQPGPSDNQESPPSGARRPSSPGAKVVRLAASTGGSRPK